MSFIEIIEPPRTYATVEELEQRLGQTLQVNEDPEDLTPSERDRGLALLIDATALIQAIARGDWDDPIPDVIRTICLNAAIRAWHNPEGVRQESIGSYSATLANADIGVSITPEEERLIRIAAGHGVALDSIQLTTGYETTSTVFVPAASGGDWLPWLAE